jgi:drug/metabolite transporter (DMT)-like permease
VVAGGFSSLGYLLVLTALREAPLSYVVPLRSMSVLLSVIAGAAFLKEGAVAWRVAAACLVALGVAAIALSG